MDPVSATSDDAYDPWWSGNQSEGNAASSDDTHRSIFPATTDSGLLGTVLSSSLPNLSVLAPSSSFLSSPVLSPDTTLATAAWMNQQQRRDHRRLLYHFSSHREPENIHRYEPPRPEHHDYPLQHDNCPPHTSHEGLGKRPHGHRHSLSDTRSSVDMSLSPFSAEISDMAFHKPLMTGTMAIDSTSTSSCATDSSWGQDDCDNAGDDESEQDGIDWNSIEPVAMVTKIEPADDEDLLSRVQEVSTAKEHTDAAETAFPGGASETQINQKRPRGRPRKHPLNSVVNSTKIAKGRSKTGCITCRRRKKKCDETKPRCLNCDKNAVFCEGYNEKHIWRSGREKAGEDRSHREYFPAITIQPILHAIETIEDRLFWRHYVHYLSNVLTVEGEARNAFKDMILQIATKHKGLMHSILSLSSRHIDLNTPYGSKLLQSYPQTSMVALQCRSGFHHDEAMKHLYDDMARPAGRNDQEHDTVLSARYGQMICLILQTRAEGNPRGEHRVHLRAYQKLIQHSPPSDPNLRGFISEFFGYHIHADQLLWYPDISAKITPDNDSWPMMHDNPWALPPPALYSPVELAACPSITSPSNFTQFDLDNAQYPARLIGVADGLFQYMSQITAMRNTIRLHMVAGIDPVVDYTCLYHAAEIDAAIREWTPCFPPGDSRVRVGLLYKQMLWVYLFRTTYPPSQQSTPVSTAPSLPVSAGPSSRRHSLVAASRPLRTTTPSSKPQAHIAQTPHTHPASPSAACTPACSKATTSFPTPSTPISPAITVQTRPETLSSTNIESPQLAASTYPHLALVTDTHSRPSSPPPIRRPPHHDRRITIAVDEALDLLESIKPSDPSQTLLLMPCLVIGTAAFDPAQRDRIRAAIQTVKGYTGLRNCDCVLDLLAELWRLMEQGDWPIVWDWQALARRMGLDFLCA
jgi:hypothetical protein